MANDNWLDPKITILIFIWIFLGIIGGYMFYANKKMISSGLYHKLEKQAKKKKENWYPE